MMPEQPQTRQDVTAGNDAYVAGRDVINNSYYASAEPAPPGLLPRDVLAFAGREDELARLAAMADGARVVVSAIGGTAGVGKTALAVHAAHYGAAERLDQLASSTQSRSRRRWWNPRRRSYP